MKKSVFISLTLLFGLQLFAACGSESKEEPTPPVSAVTVTVNPESLATGPDAANLDMTVKADADWAVRCNADWVSLRPSGGLKNQATTVQIAVKANAEMGERNAAIEIISGGKVVKAVPLTQSYVMQASSSVSSVMMSGAEASSTIKITANGPWNLSSDQTWLTISPDKGTAGETEVELKATANTANDDREAVVTLTCGDKASQIKVTQLTEAIKAPAGYSLVWHDEFNHGPGIGSDWVAENWPAGYVNHELQTYTNKTIDGKSTLEVKDGFLNITCFKASDGKIYSGRINARPSTGWLYGYFEARILLPKGKGTWPAFWMMPSNVDWNTNPWPKCGEIDIMEEVGANPNYVSSSLHTEKYNHTKNTQITHEMKCDGAEDSFHIYALEWSESEIITYVDGKVQLRASRAQMGLDHDCWPFHYPFYPILNLAWGGDWGGYKGVDEKALPATMKVDYVRIFQKK